MPVIEVNHLRKQFKSVRKQKGLKGAVKGLFRPEKKIRYRSTPHNNSMKIRIRSTFSECI